MCVSTRRLLVIAWLCATYNNANAMKRINKINNLSYGCSEWKTMLIEWLHPFATLMEESVWPGPFATLVEERV